MKNRLLIIFTLCLWCSSVVFAQKRTIQGTVYSAQDEEPMVGVSVSEQGTVNGTITDVNGHFSISIQEEGVLYVSYLGYVTQRIQPTGSEPIRIDLVENNQMLSNVVVVGYGVMHKSDITGAVISLDQENMMRKSSSNVSQGLQGAAQGVMVTMQDGAPDAKAQVRIRGVATINGSAAPLYVVDGVQVGTDADFLPASAIERIDVLKDASATAIYGAAGANGVILITTKHGSQGKSTLDVTADIGLQTLSNKLDVCGVDQYAANLRQARVNDGQVDENGNPVMWNPVWNQEYDGKRKAIDWQDWMTRAAWRQSYSLSTTGGNDKSSYSGTVDFLRNDGVVVNTRYQRIAARTNVKTTINKYVEFGSDLSYIHTDSHGSNTSVYNLGNLSSLRDFAFACPTMDFITSSTVTYDNVPAGSYISPNVKNPDGSYGEVAGGKKFNDGFWGTDLGNMYAKQMENRARKRTNRALASAYLAITPIENLTWKTLISYDYQSKSSDDFSGGIYTKRYNTLSGEPINVVKGVAGAANATNPIYYSYVDRENNEYSLSLGDSENQTLYLSNTLTYHWQKGVHNIEAMLGNDISRWYGQWLSTDATGFESPNNRDISLAESSQGYGALQLEERTLSYFGRVNYSLMNRYLLTATVRRDGSSNFGVDNQWGTFPSVALGWRLTKEEFMKDYDWVEDLKLRAGWGETGNSGSPTDLAVNGVNVDGMYVYYDDDSSLGLGNNPTVSKGYYTVLKDSKLKWETNIQTNFGLDASLFNNQWTIGLDYFIRTSKDLLLYRSIRSSLGSKQIYTNYGEILNRGVEIMIGWNKHFENDLALDITFTGSTLRNKVKKMGDPVYNTNYDASGDGTGDGSNTGAVGDPQGYHWGNHSVCMEGKAVGSYYGYRTDGIIRTQEELDDYLASLPNGNDAAVTTIGDYRFKDLNHDGKLNSEDREVLGDGFPAFYYGFNVGAKWKNWDVNMQIHGVMGQKIFSYAAMRLTNMFCTDDGCVPNLLKSSAAKAWSPTNPSGTVTRLSITDQNYNMRASDAWVKDGNFLKISNFQIGYTLKHSLTRKVLIQNVRCYLGIQNPLCISKYNKYGDPECGQGSVFYTGLDTGRYPMPRTYNFGVSINL